MRFSQRGGSGRFWHLGARLWLLTAAALLGTPASATILRVAEGASGAGNGMSWTDAYPKLQDALAAAVAGDEIWVAAGVYYPDERSGQADGTVSSNFALKVSIPLYGGFGRTETVRAERNPEANATVLSGDIGQDDLNTDGNRIAESPSEIVGTNSITVVRFTTGTGTARLDGFTVTAGSGTTSGGGLSVSRPGLTASGCRFMGNRATSGGGVNVSFSSAVFVRCEFSGNTATNGGAAYNSGRNTLFTHCVFSGNSVTRNGGAVHVTEQTQAVNCLFHSNTAASYGGAWYQDPSGPPLIAQCTMTGNSALLGGAFYSASGQATLRNSILWGNTATGTSVTLAASIAGPALPTVSCCDIAGSGGSSAWISLAGSNLGGNLDANPQFLGAASPSAPALAFRPLAGSPVVNAGSTSNLPADGTDLDGDTNVTEAIPVDLAGDPRSVGAAPDMGVFETGGGPALVASVPVLKILPNSGSHSSVLDLSEIFDATAQSFALISVTPSQIATITVDPLTGAVSITPLPDATGEATFVVSSTNANGRSNYIRVGLEVFPAVFFVDADATGAATGLSWADAFPTLQEALVRGGSSHEIRVAEGAYFPDQGGGQTPGSAAAKFLIPPGITLRGGFSGTETTAAEANPLAHPTVLSGDVGHDDANTDGNHVAETSADRVGTNAAGFLTLTGAPGNTGIDGFIITAAGSSGALKISGGSPFVRRCRFSGNSGATGGAVAVDNAATPDFTACNFSGNLASTSGGAVRASGGALTFEDCSFSGNTSNGTGGGGALNFSSSIVSLRRCTFSQNLCPSVFGNGGAIRGVNSTLHAVECSFRGNEGYDGGALHLAGVAAVSLTNCLVLENQARADGGAAYLDGIDAVFTGCGFAANRATSEGGALYHYDCSPVITQSTLAGNAAGQLGGAIYNRTYNTEDPAAPVLRNSIIWGNQKGNYPVASGASVEDSDTTHATTYSRCIIAHSGGSAAWNSELGINLGSNLDADPRFLLPPVPGVATPQSFDLRLQAGSPASHAGSNAMVPADLADVDEDGDKAEILPVDLSGKPRIAGASVDMGAYEAEPGPGWLAAAPRMRLNTLSGTHGNVLDVSTLFGASAVAFAIEAQSSATVISARAGATSGDLDITVLPESFGTTLVVVRATDASGLSSYQTLIIDVYPPAVFVNAAATGSANGLSWQNAFPTLQAALQFPRIAGLPLEIWVAQGVYYPDEGPGQTADAPASTFRLSQGCRIYGGFAGNETLGSERDPLAHPTILSGDLSQDDLNADGNSIAETTDAITGSNAYTVVTSDESGAKASIDGLVITAGDSQSSLNAGGGIFVDDGELSVENCCFRGNRAVRGGGIQIMDGVATFTDCRFSGNRVTNGGMSVIAYGGAAYFFKSTVLMTGCRLESNLATNSFTSSAEGGAIFSYAGTSLTLSDCDFIANHSSGAGGSVSIDSTPLTITDCRFTGSTTTGNSFSEGGALNCITAPATLVRCVFTGNSSGSHGGAVRFSGHQLTCSDTIFSGNSAATDGGAVLVTGFQPVRFTQCLFSGNTGAQNGGGVSSYCSDAVYAHCTFTANRSGQYGGGFCQMSTSPTNTRFTNSIFWANLAAGSSSDPSASVGREFNTTPTTLFRNSIVANSGGSSSWNPASGVNDGGNLSTDPVFLLPLSPSAAPSSTGDFQLASGSHALDMGDNSQVSVSTDLAGAPRITNGIVDMGAYEGQNDQFDLDGDGMSDAFELSATVPPSRTALDPAGDADRDGQPNLLEFALGLNPLVVDETSSSPVSIMEDAGSRYLSLRYRRNRWALQFLDISVERSLGLGSANSWSRGETTIGSVKPLGDGVDEITERSLSPIHAHPMEFLRVGVRKSAP